VKAEQHSTTFFFVEMKYILFEVGADHLYQNLIKFCFHMVKYMDVILSFQYILLHGVGLVFVSGYYTQRSLGTLVRIAEGYDKLCQKK